MATKNANNENKNVVINGVEMNEEQQLQFINDNIEFVPKCMKGRFEAMDTIHKALKIKFWQDMKQMRAESQERNKIENRVRELFDRRKVSVEDVLGVIEFCKAYIKESREQELAKIDEQIAKLNEMRNTLAQN